MNKKNNNHFVSSALAQNFRNKNSNMWKMNCQTGEISKRHTGADKLFAGRQLWSREVEDAFMAIENKISPLIKQILGAPYSDISPNSLFQVFPLSEKYLFIFSYLFQSFMFQRANTPQSKGKDEKIFAEILSSKLTPPTSAIFHIRFNPKIFETTPLLLVDNCFSIYPTPPTCNDGSDYSIAFMFPISSYNCLIGGTEEQVKYLLSLYSTPDAINKNKIIQEEKKCEVASHCLVYLEKLKTELPYLNYKQSQIQVTSERKYFLDETEEDR